MKKVLSLVLVLAMVLSSMSFAFAGTSFEDVASTDYAKAIETLTALGVVTGYEDGTYRPEKVVTRAEMAKLMVITLGYGDLVAGAKSNFTDTQGHWADAYIALAAGKGMVVGDGNGKFRPDAPVSYDEVYTMLVRGLGYTDTCNELKGMTWPTNFKVKAAELGITKNVAMSTTGADRGGVAQAIFNALEATLVTVDTDGNVKYIVDKNDNGKELLSRIATLDEEYDVTTDKLDPNNKNYACELVDLEPYMFQELKVYLNDDDQVVFVKGTNSLVIEGTVDEVTATATATTVAVEDANGKIKKVTFGEIGNVTDSVFMNGSLSTDTRTYASLEDSESIKIIATDAGSKNGKMEASEVNGFVLTQQTKVARIEKTYVEGKSKLDVFSLPVDNSDDVDLDAVKVTGVVSSLEDIEVDDVVVEYKADDASVTKLVVSRDTVEGKITRVDGTKFYVNGTKYALSETPNCILAADLALGDEGVFYLDYNGDLVDFDGESQGPTDYAVVIGSSMGSTTTKFSSTSIDDYAQVKLATQEDEEVVYDVYAKLDSAGKVTGSAKLNGSNLYTLNAPYPTGAVTTPISGIADDSLIKYSLNSDGKLNKIEIVTTSNLATDTDTTKSTFKLASDAIVFDSSDDYAVVNADRLKSEINGKAVYNKNGEIEVIITSDVKAGSVTTFAYITKVNAGYNDKGDEVQVIVAYMDGVKKDPVYTDETGVVGAAKNVYGLDLDGEVITDADLASAMPGTEVTRFMNTTASAISTKSNMIQVTGQGWAPLAEKATIIEVAADQTVNDLQDLYDIEVGTSIIDVYVNADGEVALIVIHE
jgi:S-layer family protein